MELNPRFKEAWMKTATKCLDLMMCQSCYPAISLDGADGES